MKITPYCIPCFKQQIERTIAYSTDDTELQACAKKEALKFVGDSTLDVPPPVLAKHVYRIIKKITGNEDPYREIKKKHNREVMEVYEELREIVCGSTHPLETAVKLAVAGNDIDFAASHRPGDIRKIVEGIDQMTFHINHKESFLRDLERFGKVLYLADNAGEIVFDKLLIEMIRLFNPERELDITVAVRGKPVINDVTIEDAEFIGMDEVARVINNGDDTPGTWLEDISPEMKSYYDLSDLVISKGQGNYETLDTETRLIYFLMEVKCQAVAADMGAEQGNYVLKRNPEP
jgi:uncharacterized protein with ATP-grasp and redox domains